MGGFPFVICGHPIIGSVLLSRSILINRKCLRMVRTAGLQSIHDMAPRNWIANCK
jgi:hypothetical protein